MTRRWRSVTMTGTVTRFVPILMLGCCGSCCGFSTWPCPKTGRAPAIKVRTARAVRFQSVWGYINLFIKTTLLAPVILLDFPDRNQKRWECESDGPAPQRPD